jgi:site-specific recombinase XerD
MTFADAISLYLAACAARGLSPRTVQWYAEQLTCFLRWLEAGGVNGSAWASATVIDHYLASEAARVSPSTVHAHYRALSAFFRWLMARGLLAADPLATVPPPKVPRRQPRRTSLEEYDRLLAAIPVDTWIDLRDRLAIAVLFLAGLRAGEVVGLSVEDFDLAARLLVVRAGKGGDDRLVPLLPAVARSFVEYTLARPPWPSGALMLAADGGALQPAGILTANGLRQMLRRRCEAAGLRYLNPHAFRHGLATRLLNAGGDMALVQRVLGHKTIATTAEVYAVWLTDGLIDQFSAVMERSERRKKKST